MKIQLCLVALCFAAALAMPMNSEEPPVTDSQAECITNALRKMEEDFADLPGLGEDVVDTVRRLLAQRDRCEAILNDPPTVWEERLHEGCRLAWSASVLYELNRLRGETAVFEEIFAAVQQCRA